MKRATPVLYDVRAVNFTTGAERLLAERKSERNAEAIVGMAVARRGVETEFYAVVPHGRTFAETDDTDE